MDALSQLDVTSPDHVSVITRDGKVTISVLKDGTSVTLGFQIRNPRLDSSPLPPLQQSVPMIVKKGDQDRVKPVGAPGTTHVRYRGPIPKLNPISVRDIKLLLNDSKFMSRFTSKTSAYEAIGRQYNVTGCAIGNIARGIAWNQVKV
jgi:hypothetical protein